MTKPPLVGRVTDELLERLEDALNFDGLCRPARMEGNRDLALAVRALRDRALDVVSNCECTLMGGIVLPGAAPGRRRKDGNICKVPAHLIEDLNDVLPGVDQ